MYDFKVITNMVTYYLRLGTVVKMTMHACTIIEYLVTITFRGGDLLTGIGARKYKRSFTQFQDR